MILLPEECAKLKMQKRCSNKYLDSMYELEYANSFEKDLKRCKKRGYNLQLLQEAIDILQEKGELPA